MFCEALPGNPWPMYTFAFGDVVLTGEPLWKGKSRYHPMRIYRSFSMLRAWELSSHDYVLRSTIAIKHYNHHLALFMALHPRLGAESTLQFDEEIMHIMFEIALASWSRDPAAYR